MAAKLPNEQPLERWENLRQDGTYAPNPYLAEITVDGVNRSHLRRNLRLTPAERLRQLEAWSQMIAKLRAGFRPRLHGRV